MSWLQTIREKLAADESNCIAGRDQSPIVNTMRRSAVVDRQIDELIGIVKGVMADGMVHQGEVEFLVQWMEANRTSIDTWPAKAIYPRLKKSLSDGRVDIDEEREIIELLMDTVGGNTAPLYGEPSDSTRLPFTLPVPEIRFPEQLFCFTGAFHSGSRQWCEGQIIEFGGRPASSITKKLNYLVIGEVGSSNWAHSTHGRKIEKAIHCNDAGGKIAIVSEQHWFEHLKR